MIATYLKTGDILSEIPECPVKCSKKVNCKQIKFSNQEWNVFDVVAFNDIYSGTFMKYKSAFRSSQSQVILDFDKLLLNGEFLITIILHATKVSF